MTSCQISSASCRSRNRCFPREIVVTPGGRRLSQRFMHGSGEEHLTAIARGEEPRQPVEGGSKVVTARRRLGRAQVKTHPHPNQVRLRPGFGVQCLLRGDGCGDGRGWIAKGGLKGIADRLEVPAVMGANRFFENGIVTGQYLPHAGSVVFPETGRALDVGEEKGHRA